MARRRQLVRPSLCDFGCAVEQEWDDSDPLAVPVTVRFQARCKRHEALSEKDADAAITAESDLFNGAAALVEAMGGTVDELTAEVAADGVLVVTVPDDQPLPALPLEDVVFVR